ncbi:histidine kinase [Cryptosporangium minutisporangium]|uniref:histidine kinase n=1 Tax=Cryptosporangium minutisporangium TaxID=113569 RepID=A0ABP6SRH7_9ACTN
MSNASPVYWDPFDRDIARDPYPIYRRMRAEEPLYYNEKHDFYALARSQDIESGLLDWETFSSSRGPILEIIQSDIEIPRGTLLMEDPPIHGIHRKLLSRRSATYGPHPGTACGWRRSYDAAVTAVQERSRRRETMRGVSPIPWHTGRAALAGLGAGALTVVCGAPYWREHLVSAAISVAAVAVFAAAGGLLLGSGDGRRRSGLLLLLGAVFGSLAWTASWDSGPWPLLAFYCEGGCLILSGAAVLTYPAGRLDDRIDRSWVYAAIGVLIVGELLMELVSRPEWNGLSRDVLWPTLLPDHQLFDRTVAAVIISQLVLAAWYLALLVRRGRRLSRTERPGAIPVLIATGLTAAAITLTVRSQTYTDLEALLSLFVVQNTASILLPLAVLSGALRERWREVDAPNRVVRMTSATTSVATARNALATALRDPGLRLLFWVPTEQAYVDGNGHVARRPASRPGATGRWWLDVRTDAGQPLALVEVDDGLRLRPVLVDAVLRAGSQALLTAQLQAVATAHLEQVLAAQARVEERETAERQRLQRDLHDGAQRQLTALSEQLGRLADDGLPESAREVVASCRAEVLATISEIEGLARGLHPPLLHTDGLAAALQDVAERLGLAVQLVVEAGRQPPRVEATAYFALCEGLTNVAKYAPDARVRIEVTEADGWLHGTVVDDGPGGATLIPGGGLAGVDDRIRALHGRAEVKSHAGAGTRLHVSLPCG